MAGPMPPSANPILALLAQHGAPAGGPPGMPPHPGMMPPPGGPQGTTPGQGQMPPNVQQSLMDLLMVLLQIPTFKAMVEQKLGQGPAGPQQVPPPGAAGAPPRPAGPPAGPGPFQRAMNGQ